MSSALPALPKGYEDAVPADSSFAGVPPLPKGYEDAKPVTKDEQGNFFTNTLRKTAEKMNVQNALQAVSDADSAAGRGDWKSAWESIKQLNPLNMVKQVYGDVTHGNASDVASDALSLGLGALGGAEGATGKAGAASNAVGDVMAPAADTVKTAAKGGVQGLVDANTNWKMSAATQPLVAGIGYLNHGAGVATEAGIQGIHMVRGAVKALKERAAAQGAQDAQAASDTAIAAQRKAGRTPLRETQPQPPPPPTPPPAPAAPVDIEAAQQALKLKAASRYQPPPPVAPVEPSLNNFLQLKTEIQKIKAKLAEQSASESTQPTSAVDIAAAQQELRAKAAARKGTVVATPATNLSEMNSPVGTGAEMPGIVPVEQRTAFPAPEPDLASPVLEDLAKHTSAKVYNDASAAEKAKLQQTVSEIANQFGTEPGKPLAHGSEGYTYDLGSKVLKILPITNEEAAARAAAEQKLGAFANPTEYRTSVPFGSGPMHIEVSPKIPQVLPYVEDSPEALKLGAEIHQKTGVSVDTGSSDNFGYDAKGNLKVIDPGRATLDGPFVDHEGKTYAPEEVSKLTRTDEPATQERLSPEDLTLLANKLLKQGVKPKDLYTTEGYATMKSQIHQADIKPLYNEMVKWKRRWE